MVVSNYLQPQDIDRDEVVRELAVFETWFAGAVAKYEASLAAIRIDTREQRQVARKTLYKCMVQETAAMRQKLRFPNPPIEPLRLHHHLYDTYILRGRDVKYLTEEMQNFRADCLWEPDPRERKADNINPKTNSMAIVSGWTSASLRAAVNHESGRATVADLLLKHGLYI